MSSPEQSIVAASDRWAELFASGDADRIVTLYAPDGVLWGTLSPTLRQGPAPLRDYFVNLFELLPGHRVSFGERLIRIYGETAIQTGYYTFSYVKQGETRTLPARFSFVYRRTDDGWLIVDHHSSAIPLPLT